MDSEIRKIQQKCTEILQVVDEICRRNHITYSLNGGSVVGAHLYGGCLPWDDDIDLLMTRRNYNRFIKVAKAEFPDKYALICYQTSKEFSVGCAKVMDNDTTIVEKDGHVSGIFIDITVYDRVPQNFLRNIDFFLRKIAEIVLIGKAPNTTLSRRIRNLALSTILRNKKLFFKFFEKTVVFLGKFGKYKYSELLGGGYTQTKPYEPHIFENYSEIEFEGKNYMIMRDYIDYLVTRYERTDFHEPKEKQVPSHYKYVNFELPYKEYLKQINDSVII